MITFLRGVFGLLCLALLCLPSRVQATACVGIASGDTCRTVIPSIDGMVDGVQHRNLSADAYAKISVTCYHDVSIDNICAGGGDFDRDTGCTLKYQDNGVTVIRDAASPQNCFFRKNFGLNGIVDARQCGVYGDGVHEDGALLYQCLEIAAGTYNGEPLLQNPIAVVNTGGGVILDDDTRLVIPTNVELNCGGGTSVRASNNDYRNITVNNVPNLSSALVLGPDLHVTSKVTTNSAIELSDGASLTGCLVEASDKGMSGTVINPYAPSVFYPGCSDVNSCPGDSVYIRSAIEERDAFSAPQPPNCTSRPASCEIAIRLLRNEGTPCGKWEQ